MFAEFARRSGREAAAALRGARWWLLAVAVLCAADQTIRVCAFHGGISRAAAFRMLRLCLFYGSICAAPAFVVGRFSRLAAPFLFGTWLLIESVQLWVLNNFNMVLGGNWVLMVFSTSGAEVGEFVSGFFTAGNVLYVLLALAAVAAVSWFFASRHGICRAPSRVSACMAVLCAAFACLMAPLAFRRPVTWAQISRDMLALSLPVDTAANWRSYRALAASCREKPRTGLSVAHGSGKGNLCVFIIGESTTRSHMGIYGYWRDTTPELAGICKEAGMTVFSDLTTTHSSTPEALCSLFTGTDLSSGCAFPAVFPAMLRDAGYKTSLVSCQGNWQNRDVVGSHLFLSCGSRQFLQGGRVAGTLPDGVALPVVEKIIGESSGDIALFVHLYGCHNPATKRVPRDFSREWEKDPGVSSEKARRKIDSYDTAVAYDDHIVASIIKAAAGKGVPTCVFFVSDHGESPASPIWRDVKSRDTFEVPLLVWLSPEYRAAYPDTAARVEAAKDRRLWMDQLLEGMLELARVEGYRPWDSPGNFIAPGFEERREPPPGSSR